MEKTESNSWNDLLLKAKIIAVVCLQWGDTGKGKIVDFIARSWAKITARGTGGDNAGHSICSGGKELVTHIIPSGIIYDKEGMFNVIGSGVVFNPRSFVTELKTLDNLKLSYNNLLISKDAKLILPWNIIIDRIGELKSGSSKIGTTGKGITPAYLDFYARRGLKVNDLQNYDIFIKKLKHNFESAKMLLKNYDPEIIKSVMEHEQLESGAYYHPIELVDLDVVINKYHSYFLQFNEMIFDTDSLIRARAGKDNILLEGAQGLGLSIDYGTYPFVTSSDCSVFGLAKGAGLLDASQVDLTLGITKGFYMTRVGRGPFPTELGGSQSDVWCNGEGTRVKELEFYGNPGPNAPSDFLQGVGLRQIGGEYGATTGRPRRVGWNDLVFLRYAFDHTKGLNLVMNKLDILNDVNIIKLCVNYIYTGEDYVYGDKILKSGDILLKAIPDAEVLQYCQPVYKEFPGWKCSLEGISRFEDLPVELRNIADFIKKETGVTIRIISTGRDREETIFC